ncbi:MAG: YbhN family protein [Bryobacterales bacterium]|nr:YbhN family protein [Bryobacterales bacterium]
MTAAQQDSPVESGGSEPETAPSASSRSAWFLWLAASAALLWVFHDISWRTMLRQLQGVELRWLLPAIAADIFSYCCQGVRWRYLLKPAGKISSLKATQAIYVGLFVNEILPMRVGELAAAFLAGRWLRLPIAQVLPSMLVGRLFDGVWLALAVAALLILVPLPSELKWAGDLFGLATAVGIALFLLLLIPGVRKRLVGGESSARDSGVLGTLRGWFADLVNGIHEIRGRGILIPAAAASLGVLVFQTLAFWCVIAAYRLPVTVLAGVAVFLIVHLGTAIPNAPANVGSFQLFTVLGLGLFGIEKDLAAGFSAGVFLVLTVPLWLIGLFALSRTGLTLRGMRDQLRRGA